MKFELGVIIDTPDHKRNYEVLISNKKKIISKITSGVRIL